MKENKNEILKALVINAKVMVLLVFLVSFGLAIYTTIVEVNQMGNDIAHEKNAHALESGNGILNAKLGEIKESYKQQRSDLQSAKDAELKGIEADFVPKINQLKAQASSAKNSSPDWAKSLDAQASKKAQEMEKKKSVIENEYSPKFQELNLAQKAEEQKAEGLKTEIISTAATGASLKLGSFNKLSYFLGAFTLLSYVILLFNLHGRALASKHAGEDLSVSLGAYEEKVNANNLFHALKEQFLYRVDVLANCFMPKIDEITDNVNTYLEVIAETTVSNYAPEVPTMGFHATNITAKSNQVGYNTQNSTPEAKNELNVQSNFMAEQKAEALRVLNSKKDNPEQQAQKQDVESFEVIPTEKLLLHAKRDINDRLRINNHRQKTQLGTGSTFETTQRNIESAKKEMAQIDSLLEKQRKQMNIFDVIGKN